MDDCYLHRSGMRPTKWTARMNDVNGSSKIRVCSDAAAVSFDFAAFLSWSGKGLGEVFGLRNTKVKGQRMAFWVLELMVVWQIMVG